MIHRVRYRPVCCTIWEDDKFPYASDDCQLVWFHAFTNRLSSGIGLYKASIAGLAEEKNWDLARYRKAFEEALQHGFIEYDPRTHLIYFPHYFTKERTPNHPQSANVVVSWGKYFQQLPPSPLKAKCYQSLKALLEGFDQGFMEAFSKAFGETMPESVTVTVTAIRDPNSAFREDLKEEDMSGSKASPDAVLFLDSQESQTNGTNGTEEHPSLTHQAEEVLNHLNKMTGHQFRFRENGHGKLSANAEMILARLKSGATVADCKSIIAKQAREWKGDPKTAKWLRPSTLFGREKFEQYLGVLRK